MLQKSIWQFAVGFALLVAITMLLLGYQLTRPACLGNADCTKTAVAVGALWLFFSGTLLGGVIASRAQRPVGQLINLVQRVTAGDRHARLLLPESGEPGELVRAVHQMKDGLVSEIEALTEQQQQMTHVVEYMADGVLIVNDASYIQLMNPQAALLLNTDVNAAAARSFAEVARHHQLIELFQQSQRTQTPQVRAFELDRGRFLQMAVTPFREEGTPGFLIILQDLTPVRRLETVRRDFISNLSHELRTPLASLRAVVETLQDGARSDPEMMQYFLQRAVGEVDTMTQMVQELLELSRIESGRVPLRLVPTAVSDLLLLPMERFRAQAERSDIRLQLDLSRGLPLVLADAPRIQQVVTNLLHNAIKFSSLEGTIRLRAYQAKPDEEGQADASATPMVIIDVKDNGCGISATDLPRIFERFYKSDRARTRGEGGTGLGLAIARHLVEAHQGQIWVKSKENKGSTFFFSLPIVEQQMSHKPPEDDQ